MLPFIYGFGTQKLGYVDSAVLFDTKSRKARIMAQREMRMMPKLPRRRHSPCNIMNDWS